MNKDEQKQECDDVLRWVSGKSRKEINERLDLLYMTNSMARSFFDQANGKYGTGPDDPGRAYEHNGTGYSQPGSANWEHDDTGNDMNFSGVMDEFVNARIEGEGLEPGYDYNE